MNRTRRGLFGLVMVAGCWAAVQTSAQSPPAQTPPTPPPGQTAGAAQQPTFRSRVDSVSVDVTVTDKQGRPVVDLQARDFEVKEGKQVQKVETFQFIQVDTLVGSNSPRDILSANDQERELARPGTRLVVIFLDDYHVRRINSMRVREQLARFVSLLTNNDLVAVMTPLTPASALTFSYDHDATARVVAAFDGRKYDYTARNPLEARYQMLPVEQIEQIRNSMVLGAVESVCTYLGAIRDGRKMLLFVSEGLNSSVPVSVGMGATVVGSGAGSPISNNALDLQSKYNRIYQAAARANTSVSTFDPRGLTMSEGMPRDVREMEQDRQLLLESTDQLRNLANQTDGRALVGTNDPFPGLRQMMDDLSAYYLLGYTSVAPHDGKFHEIQVRVNRKDVEVHARKGYWAHTEDEIAKATAPVKAPLPRDVNDALGTLASSGDMATRRLVRAWMGASAGATGQAVVTFVWETTAATLPPEAADRVDHVTVTATSIYGDRLFNGRVASDPQAARPTGSVTFEAPAGGVRAHVVPENAKGLRLDEHDETFDVPNFTSGKPLITAPVVYRARTARDIQQLRTATAAMPAITREFSRTERLLLRFQVYGPAGAPAAVTMQLLNQQGTAMSALPSPTATANNGYEAEVGLGPLPTGTYVIAIDADFGGRRHEPSSRSE